MKPNVDIHSDETLVKQLLRRHALSWADLPVRRVASSGTDNALYRLGETMVVRVPRRLSAVPLLAKEATWLRCLVDLPLKVPVPRLVVGADEDFQHGFAIFDWLEGVQADPGALESPDQAARALAAFLKALQATTTDGAPLAGNSNHQRGVALELLSANTIASIETLADEIDAQVALELWRQACQVEYRGDPVWVHGDLKADNLIARDGQLTAVIDWGLSAVGDPAADYAAAWSWIEPAARGSFRSELALDDDDWLRAKGWALYGAVIALSYYRGGKNEALCRQSRQTLTRLDLLT